MSFKVKVDRLFTKGRTLILAYDQGFEHGPSDFNLTNVDPEFIMDIALEGFFNAVAVHSGIAEKYYDLRYKDVPLIVKLNGKTSLQSGDPVSRAHTSVEYAAKLGASAVGYTLYLGSSFEQEQFRELGRIVEEAHSLGLPVMVWNYPRGSSVPNDLDTNIIAYGARVALELGADIIKLKYNGDKEALRWIVKNAGRAKVVISGGSRTSEEDFLRMVWDVVDAGAAGIAVGRNVWQHERPFSMSRALRDIVIDGKSVEEALKRFNH